MSDVQYRVVNEEEAGQRLDNYLLRILKGVPKSHIYRIIRGGEVRLNKKRIKVFARLTVGDIIRIPPVRTASASIIKVKDGLEQFLKNTVLFEDNELMVINKPAGMAVHGGSGLSLGVIEALREIRKDLSYLELVHRLDKETSGCLLIAKKRSMLRAVQSLFAERKINKIYWALLSKPWQRAKSYVVEAGLVKNILKSGERMVTVSDAGKPALTKFKLLENFEHSCLVEASPQTGRTHQIRVHSAYLGHPIIGDSKYGYLDSDNEAMPAKNKLYLHAHSIRFNLNGKEHYYEAKLDACFVDTLRQLQGAC